MIDSMKQRVAPATQRSSGHSITRIIGQERPQLAAHKHQPHRYEEDTLRGALSQGHVQQPSYELSTDCSTSAFMSRNKSSSTSTKRILKSEC